MVDWLMSQAQELTFEAVYHQPPPHPRCVLLPLPLLLCTYVPPCELHQPQDEEHGHFQGNPLLSPLCYICIV